MSFIKGIRSASSRTIKPSSLASPNEKKRHLAPGSNERKMRSLQSLQEKLCFTLKRPRTRRRRKSGGPNPSYGSGYGGCLKQAHSHTIVESGLIQIPHLQYCEYYESPSPLSISSCFSQESAATTATNSTTTTTCRSSINTTASSALTNVSATHSPPYNSSDEGFSCDEVMSLVSYHPDMVMHNVLDFIDNWGECGGGGVAGRAVIDKCESKTATSTDQLIIKVDHPHPPSTVEDDGEPYRIDLCDFEPDVNALSSPPQEGAHHHQKNYGGGVLSLRLDYEEVLRAWKERGECLISRDPIYYPPPHLDPLHIFGYASFVPQSPFF